MEKITKNNHVDYTVLILLLINKDYEKITMALFLNPLSPGGTYMVHKEHIFLSIPGLQGLIEFANTGHSDLMQRYVLEKFM